MKVAVLGGGNGGHACAGHLALQGHEVNMYELPEFKNNVATTMKQGSVLVSGPDFSGIGKLNKVTTNIEEAIEDVKVVMLVVPAFAQKRFAETFERYLEDDQFVVLNPGYGGSLELYKILKDKVSRRSVKIGETNTLTYACRIQTPGQVRIELVCTKIRFAAMPSKFTDDMLSVFRELYPSTIKAKNVLETCLLIGNPMHHTAGTIFNAGRIEYAYGQLKGNLYKTGEDFYMYREGLTPSVVRIIEALEQERLEISGALALTETTQLRKLYEHGYSVTVDGEPFPSLYEAYHSKVFSGSLASKGPTSLKERYITEDVPYGLVTWSSLGEILGVKTPTMRALIHLASILNETDYWEKGRTTREFGIANMTAGQLNNYVSLGEEPAI